MAQQQISTTRSFYQTIVVPLTDSNIAGACWVNCMIKGLAGQAPWGLLLGLIACSTRFKCLHYGKCAPEKGHFELLGCKITK